LLYVVGGTAFLAGQIYFFQGQIEKALPLSIFGVVLGFAGRLLPRNLVSLGLLAARSSPAAIRVWFESQKTAPKTKRPKGKKVLVEEPADQVVFSRIWLLAPGLFFAALSQLFLINGQVALAVISIAGLALFLAVFLQDTQMPLVIPHPVQNLKIAVLMAAGLGVQIWGGVVLWEYKDVMFGFVLTSLASLFMLWLLWKYPLRFIQGPDDRPQDLQGSKPLHFFSSRIWTRKALLLGTAAFTAYLAKFIFAATSLNLSVTLGFIAIFLLIASFPWLPHGLASWQLVPKSLRSVMALALAGFAFYAGHLGQSAIERNQLDTGLWWFLAGGILLILAVQDDPSTSLIKSPTADLKANPETKPKSLWPTVLEVLAVAILVSVGFAFRVWRVGEFPYGAEGDEAGGGLWALDALHGRVENPFVSANVALHFFTLTGWIFKYFGVSITTLRIHAVIFGTLSLITTYFFLRLFWGRWVAYLTTALMSFAYWHLHFSRFGHYVIEQVCCQMAAFFFFFLGVKNKSFIPFIFGGVFFGLAIMPGVASRLLPFQGIALLIYLFASRRDILRTHANGLLAFVIAAWMITSPAMVYWFRTLPMSTRRSAEVSIFNRAEPNAPVSRVAGFVQNGKVSLFMFNHRGDTRSRDNPVAPERILERWTAALFALALVFSLYNFRLPVFFFLLICFFINLAASVFSVEAPQTHRSAGNIPIVFAIIAPRQA